MLALRCNVNQKLIAEKISIRSFYTKPRKMNRSWTSMVYVAAGVGLLAGTTSVLLYHYLLGRRYTFVLERDLNYLHGSLQNLKCEFEELKNNRKSRRSKCKRRNRTLTGSTTSITDVSMYSAVESDFEDDFCDVSHSEDDATYNTMRLLLSSYDKFSGVNAKANEKQT